MAGTKRLKTGRPPKGDFAGKSEQITTRVTPATKEALRQAVERERRSESQIIEMILYRGLSASYAILDRAPGPGYTHTFAAMVDELATAIEAHTGKSWREDRFTFDALKEGLNALLAYLPPPGRSVPSEALAKRVKEEERSEPRTWLTPKGLGANAASMLWMQLQFKRLPPDDLPPGLQQRYTRSDRRIPKLGNKLRIQK